MKDLVHDLEAWTPRWEKSQTFPVRYHGTEEEYFALDTKQLVEYSEGCIELPPSPTTHHQRIAGRMLLGLDSFAISNHLGTVLFGGYPVRLWPGKFRAPDILFMQTEHASRLGERFSEGADLVMEILSPKNRRHDLVTKRGEYAQAGIPEYWIVDPEEETITVLTLQSRQKTSMEHGRFTKGTRATSKLLSGFSVEVTTALTQKPAI